MVYRAVYTLRLVEVVLAGLRLLRYTLTPRIKVIYCWINHAIWNR